VELNEYNLELEKDNQVLAGKLISYGEKENEIEELLN
jgi:hypothetical protein